MKRIFDKQELLDMDLPYAAIQDNIIDNTRCTKDTEREI